MIRDQLNKLIKENIWNEEELLKINNDDFFYELKQQIEKNKKINWDIYSAIPELLTKAMSENNISIFENPFYERIVLISLYLQAYNIDTIYSKFLLEACNPARACFILEQELNKQTEYAYLKDVYQDYCLKSQSIIYQQLDILKNLSKIDNEQYEKMMEDIKSIVKD